MDCDGKKKSPTTRRKRVSRRVPVGLFDGCDIYASLLRSHMKSIKISIKK